MTRKSGYGNAGGDRLGRGVRKRGNWYNLTPNLKGEGEGEGADAVLAS